ncbi:MAG: hypothetical protein ACLGGX_09665, partial [Bdellovibrionia bacterium]
MYWITTFIFLFSLNTWAMGKRPVDPPKDSNIEESKAGNCHLLANYAKTPRWTLQAPPGVKANYLMADKKRRQLHLLRDGKVIR